MKKWLLTAFCIALHSGTAFAQEKERFVKSLSLSGNTQSEACTKVKTTITNLNVHSGVKIVKMNACECGVKSDGDVLCNVDYVLERRVYR